MNLILYAIPFFFLLMGLEAVVARARGRVVYRAADVVTDLSLGTMQVVFGAIFGHALQAPYRWLSAHARVVDVSSWPEPVVGVVAFVAVDFCYYWFHRSAHRVALGWATHAPHHSSEDYNLAVALRQGPVQPAISFAFYLPLAVLGVPVTTFATLSAINTLYQFWIHTELLDRLGPLEWVLNTPSHHRVHHGCNGRYLDKNHAGVLIVWDRLFGTFQAEHDTPVYGTVKPLATWNPLRAAARPFVELASRVQHARGIADVVAAVLGPPEWRPFGVPAAPVVDGARAKFDRRVSTAKRRAAVALYVASIALLAGILFVALPQGGAMLAGSVTALVIVYGVIGRLLDDDI